MTSLKLAAMLAAFLSAFAVCDYALAATRADYRSEHRKQIEKPVCACGSRMIPEAVLTA